MIVHECDRCGSRKMEDSYLIKYQKGSLVDFRLNCPTAFEELDIKELCEQCFKDFERFIDMGVKNVGRRQG